MDDNSTSEEQNNDWYSYCFDISAVAIFLFVAFNFLFPNNKLIPLDRRCISVLGSALVYITRTFAFPHRNLNLIEAIDFDVLVLLASIMVINHIVVHLKETKTIIDYLQRKIRENPVHGFWIVSLSSFICSPFLTNDGICLLFVEPILSTFGNIDENQSFSNESSLWKTDALFFLLTLACSSNIGSALTYTGNPQNMIVSQDAISVLSPLQFLGIMICPSLCVWIITSFWILRCWQHDRKRRLHWQKLQSMVSSISTIVRNEDSGTSELENGLSISKACEIEDSSGCNPLKTLRISRCSNSPAAPMSSPVLSPRRKRARERQEMLNQVVPIVTSPIPYVVLLLLIGMIVMIFVDVMSITGLVCISAIIMIIFVVFGNHWCGRPIWAPIPLNALASNSHKGPSEEEDERRPNRESFDDDPFTEEDKVDSRNEFFEELFKSIDYSLLIIFLGTFLIVANLDSTGIPRLLWTGIVGRVPFQTFGSVVGISLFVLLASQLLGNVAVVEMAKSNVQGLDDQAKRFAWCMISFIATIGGNLTITGSAANIIVAEKSQRIDPRFAINFWTHFRICGLITLLSCVVGGVLIAAISQALSP